MCTRVTLCPLVRYWARVRAKPTTTPTTTPTPTTTAPPLRQLLSTSNGIFSSFRPDLNLRIDTFRADTQTTLYDLHTGLRLRDSTRLVLEPSGFRVNDGTVAFSGHYGLDRRLRSPFSATLSAEDLDLSELRTALAPFRLSALDHLGAFDGRLSVHADVTGKLHEGRQRPIPDSTHATVRLRLTDAELRDWPAVADLGRRIKMGKRFRHLRFAPLELDLRVDSGRLYLPETEIQSTALQVFVEGSYDSLTGPDLLIAVPLRNIGRGVLAEAPAPTGFARAGWKIYLVLERNKHGVAKMRFRLGRRKFYRQRGRLEELRARRGAERGARRSMPEAASGRALPTRPPGARE